MFLGRHGLVVRMDGIRAGRVFVPGRGGTWLRGDGGRASPMPPLLPLGALLANHPAVQHWAGHFPLLACIGKPSEKKNQLY